MEPRGVELEVSVKVGYAARAIFVAAFGLWGAACRADAHQPEGSAEASASTATCGRPPLAPCPLQRWMDANLAPAFREGRLERLVEPLRALAKMTPKEFPRWAALAEAGAKAAAAGDLAAVRDTCGGCHDSYRKQYRESMRARPIPDGRKEGARTL